MKKQAVKRLSESSRSAQRSSIQFIVKSQTRTIITTISWISSISSKSPVSAIAGACSVTVHRRPTRSTSTRPTWRPTVSKVAARLAANNFSLRKCTTNHRKSKNNRWTKVWPHRCLTSNRRRILTLQRLARAMEIIKSIWWRRVLVWRALMATLKRNDWWKGVWEIVAAFC